MADRTTQGEDVLDGLVGIVTRAASRVLEVSPELQKVLADEVATAFSAQFGGQVCYLPKGRVFHTSALYRQIWERFNGTNQPELAREFGLSVIHIYRIISIARERDRDSRQTPLPGL